MAIHITNATELQNINLDLTADYILDNDIDLTGVPWTPIGDYGLAGFVGTFDGQGFTISNLTFDDGTNYNFAGLFGVIGDYPTANPGSVSNLNLDGFVISGGYAVGACAGYMESGTITNVHVTNSVMDLITFGFGVGALIGDSYARDLKPSAVINCSCSNITITAFRSEAVGGLIGEIFSLGDDSAYHVYNCSTDNVSIAVSHFSRDVGGVVGYAEGYIYKCSATNLSIDMGADANTGGDGGGISGFYGGLIANCYAQGTIVNCDFECGGIAGISDSDYLVKNCYADVDISGDGVDTDLGGLFGAMYTACTVRNCFSVGTVSAAIEHGGFVGGFFDDVVFENCSWLTSSDSHAIGYDNSHGGSVISLLVTVGYGTDESVESNFYHKTHPVYAQV